MKTWKYGIIVCLCIIVSEGLSINIPSNNDLKSLEMEKFYDIDNGEHATQSAGKYII